MFAWRSAAQFGVARGAGEIKIKQGAQNLYGLGFSVHSERGRRTAELLMEQSGGQSRATKSGAVACFLTCQSPQKSTDNSLGMDSRCMFGI